MRTAKSHIISLFLFLTSALILLTPTVRASVWEDYNQWDDYYEEQYSNWISSRAVYERMFIDSSSPYKGIRADCADAAYALRAIFSFENGLPFAINDPSGSRSGRTINNQLSKWDNYGSRQRRLVAMINTIGDSVGSENLTHFDTYPIRLKNIHAGAVFSYKIQARFGKFIRHVYNIKGINPVGTFDTIYSTQAIADKGLPMTRRKDKEFINSPHTPWGFRAFKWPRHVTIGTDRLPSNYEASNEQYNLVAQLGSDRFFKLVKETVATIRETPQQQMRRSFDGVCEESVARIEYVNQALSHLRSIGGRCMDYQEFDAYSTPSRDTTLAETFKKFEDIYDDLGKTGELAEVNRDIIMAAQTIFDGYGMDLRDLRDMCAISYRPGVSIDLATLWNRIRSNKLSSHPNDTVELRWGEKTSPQTRCRRWY